MILLLATTPILIGRDYKMVLDIAPSDMQYFTSEQIGAPQMIGGSNGDMLHALDACLLTGWGSQPVQSAQLADGIVTLQFGISHGFLNKQRISIQGFNDTSLDGIYRIEVLTPTSLSFESPSALSVIGALTVKIAPLGWESLFGSTDPLKRAYRSLAATHNNRILFLDMSYPDPSSYNSESPPNRAMVTVCQDMDVLGVPLGDMTNNINQKPTNANGSLFWYQKRDSGREYAITKTPSKWTVVGNSEFFYLIIGWSSDSRVDNSLSSDVYGFGKYADLTNGVMNDSFLMAHNWADDVNTGSGYPGLLGSSAVSPVYIFNESSEAVAASRMIITNSKTVSGEGGLFPNSYGNSIFATPYRIYIGNEIRGCLMSILSVDNAVPLPAYDKQVIDDLLILGTQSVADPSATNLRAQAFYIGG